MSDTRRFHLERGVDVTGASGTGHVADGVVWPDGAVTIRWRGERKSTVNWDRLSDAEAVHGHRGGSRIVWDDQGIFLGQRVEEIKCADCWREEHLTEEQRADPANAIAASVNRCPRHLELWERMVGAWRKYVERGDVVRGDDRGSS